MEWLHKKIYSSIKYINILALFIMFSVLILQVFTRKVLNTPLSWPEELSLITMIWVTFFGAYQITADNEHLKIDFLSNKLSGRMKLISDIISNLLILFFLVMVVYWAYPFIMQNKSIVMPVSQIPMWLPYGIIWISCILMTLNIIFQTIKIITRSFNNKGGTKI